MRRNKHPARPRNVHAAITKFAEWNMWGKGKSELSCRSSVYWYRDDIFYRGYKPVMRAMHAEGVGTVLFKLYDENCGWWRIKELIPDDRMFNIHDICVSGTGMGMAMGKAAFLANVRKQLLGHADFLVEQAKGLSFQRCAEWVEKHGKIIGGGGTYGGHKYTDYAIDTRINTIRHYATMAAMISRYFKLDWPSFPTEALVQEFLRIVSVKAKRYVENTPRRERTKARKDGAKALEIAA